MDLFKELDEFKELWGSRTPLGRFFLSVSFFLALMSVGSIADTVFEFKGFIIQAIDYYRGLTDPARKLIKEIFHYSINFDLLLLASVMLSGFFRINAKINQHRIGMGRFLGMLAYSASVMAVCYTLAYVSNLLVAQLITIALLPLMAGFFLNKSFSISPRYKYLSAYMLFVYLLVGIIAAISEGVTRES